MTTSCKRKTLTSIPITHMKKSDMKAYTHNPRCGERGTKRSLGLNGQCSWPNQQVSDQ